MAVSPTPSTHLSSRPDWGRRGGERGVVTCDQRAVGECTARERRLYRLSLRGQEHALDTWHHYTVSTICPTRAAVGWPSRPWPGRETVGTAGAGEVVLGSHPSALDALSGHAAVNEGHHRLKQASPTPAR